MVNIEINFSIQINSAYSHISTHFDATKLYNVICELKRKGLIVMSACIDKNWSVSFLDSKRALLHSIVEKNQFNLQKEEVQKASQRMDQLILYWYRTNKKSD